MKTLFFSLCTILICSCANGKDVTFTGSTPAGDEVRQFLGISLSDSIDFIRWKLSYNDRKYELTCNYGIGKPNTNGFYNGGKHVQLKGEAKRELMQMILVNGKSSIVFAEINEDLIQFLNHSGQPIPGNGGWSYTLNNMAATIPKGNAIPAMRYPTKDSTVYVGRTPCGIPGLDKSKDCYKLKWKLVLYSEGPRKGTYTIYSTNWSKENLTGTWDLSHKNKLILFELKDKSGKIVIRLMPLMKLMLFTDAEGKLLVGNEDFSYTLSML